MAWNGYCEYCEVSFSSHKLLWEHVSGTEHMEVLEQIAPGELVQLDRLQYFIDRYLRSRPILGLEYVEEEKQADSSYMYTCLLCDKKYTMQWMVLHVTNLEHMERYIREHHRHMLDKYRFPRSRRHMENLARVICTFSGRTVIHVKKLSVDSVNLGSGSDPSPNEGDKQHGTLPHTGDNLQTDCTKERLLDNSGGEQEEGLMGSSQRLENSKQVPMSYVCNLCSIHTVKAINMHDHVMGKKHSKKLLLSAPEEVKECRSLSYFLRTHFKEHPILGLEYISEWKEDSVYRFFCELCTKKSNLRNMIAHITDVDHMERYIRKHHAKLLTDVLNSSKRPVYMNILRDVAVKILEKDGRKEIKLQKPTIDGPTKFPGGDSKTSKAFKDKEGEVIPPSIRDSGNTFHAKRKPSPQLELGPEQMLKKAKINDPPLAKSSSLLPEYDQEALPSSTCISECRDPCLLITAMVDHTTAKQNALPSSTCNLGNRDPRLLNQETTMVDCTAAKQGALPPSTRISECKDSRLLNKEVTVMVDCTTSKQDALPSSTHISENRDLRLYSKEETVIVDGTTIKQDALLSSTHISETRDPHLLNKEETVMVDSTISKQDAFPSSTCISEDSDPHSLNKELRVVDCITANEAALPSRTPISVDSHLHLHNKEVISRLDCSTAKQGLKFRTNNQFLEYLANFVIDDHKDASFIQKITQNCIKVLKTFHENKVEELKSSCQPQAPLPHTSRADPKPLANSGNKTESCSSSSETALLKVAPTIPLGLPKTKVIEEFFNRIKNMNESEVVSIFQNIAATNPEFKGMKIPVVIRFLKKSGAIKQS